MKELKAIEILREKLKELWDTRPFWFGDSKAHHEKIFAVEDAIKELVEIETKIQNMCAECECAKFADNAIKPSEMWKLHSILKDNK